MGGKFEIKATVTGAQEGANDIKKLGDALDKLTEAEKRAAKSAKDSAQFFKALQDAVVSRKDQEDYLTGLTKEAKAHEATGNAAKKTAGIKGNLLDASKKLQAQIPGLSFVIGSLKNPFTALIAVLALTIDSLVQIKQRMDDLKAAVGDGRITTNFERIGQILAESKVNATQLADKLKEIRNRPENTQERADRQRTEMERRLKAEAMQDEVNKAGELAGVADPAAKATIEAKFGARAKQREQRRLAGEANILAQAQVHAQDAVRAGVAGNADEVAMLDAAKQRHRTQMELADAQFVSPEKLNTMIMQRDELSDTLNTPMLHRSVRGLQLTGSWRGDEGMKGGLAMLNDNIAMAQSGNRNVGSIRRMADADLQTAETRFQNFIGGTTAAQEEVRRFGIARTNAVADASAMQPFNDPGAASFLKAQREMQAAFEEYHRKLLLMFNDGQRRVDALSRAAAAQAQQGGGG